MQHRNVLLVAGSAVVLGAAVLTFVVLRTPAGQPPGAERAEAGAPAVPMAAAEPAATREGVAGTGEELILAAPIVALPEEPLGDAWRTIPPASGPVIYRGLSEEEEEQNFAGRRFLIGIMEARPFTRQHAAALLAGLAPDQHLAIRHASLLVMAVVLAEHPDLDSEIRAVFREALLEYLGASDPLLLQFVPTYVGLAGLWRDEEVMAKVRAIATRPGPHSDEWQRVVDRAIEVAQYRDILP